MTERSVSNPKPGSNRTFRNVTVICLLLAAAAFFVAKFNTAKNNVDDPTKTVVGGG